MSEAKIINPNQQNQIGQAQCLKWKEPNIPNEISSIKATKQNPLNQFYKTESKGPKYTEI